MSPCEPPWFYVRYGSGRLDACPYLIAQLLEPGTDAGVACHRVQEIELGEDGINLARAPDGTVTEIRRGDPRDLLIAQRVACEHPEQIGIDRHRVEPERGRLRQLPCEGHPRIRQVPC